MWVGSLHGLLRFDPSTGVTARHDVASGDLASDWVTACVPWEGGVAAGTYDGGLALLGGPAPVGSQREIVRESDGLPSGWVNPHAMRADGDALLVGTLEGGLVIGRPSAERRGRGPAAPLQTWKRLDLSDALPSADVTSFAPGPEGGTWRSTWVGTRGGLARVAWPAH
jgi:hypothetical protein